MTFSNRIHMYFGRVFTLDVRSLALMRIMLGGILLYDLASKAFFLFELYGKHSLVPPEFLESAWSLHTLFDGASLWVVALFAAHAAAAACMLAGYRTRIATVVSCVLLLSLNNANPYILHGADVTLQLAFIIGMFLPLGAVFSVDHTLRPRTLPNMHTLSVWTAALVIQLALVYLFSALLKYNDAWKSGLAVYYALSGESFAAYAAVLVGRAPYLIKLTTYGVWVFEHIAPILLLAPYKTVPIRAATLALLAVMHVAFMLFLSIGFFSWVMLALLVALMPSDIWEWFSRRIPNPRVFAWLESPAITTPSQTEYQSRVLARIAGVLGCVYIAVAIWINIAGLGSPKFSVHAPPSIAHFLRSTGLYQKWRLYPFDDTRFKGWHVAKGTLLNGSYIDLLRGGAPFSFEKPNDTRRIYPYSFWRMYFEQLQKPAFADRYGMALCRTWNASHDEESTLASIEVIRMFQLTPPPGEPWPPAQPITLASITCPAESAS